MRLTDHERQTLLQAIEAADPAAEIWLHGSRVNDDARGGDIDLLVLSQRIDLTIARDTQRPFVRLARAQGVRL